MHCDVLQTAANCLVVEFDSECKNRPITSLEAQL